MARYRLKRFSLSEGGYTGEKASAKKTYIRQSGVLGTLGGVIGSAIKSGSKGKNALIGAGLGSILGIITAALTRSSFNKKPKQNITTKRLFVTFSNMVSRLSKVNREDQYSYTNLETFDIDSNQNNFDVQVKSNEDSIVLLIRKLNKEEENIVSNILDEFCYFKKYNDYTSELTEDGGWIITVKLVDYKEAAELLVELMDEAHFRINFLTR